MIYIDKDEKIRCTNCCINCDENKKTCEARKERAREIRRMTYKARKEYEKRKQGEKI